MSAAAIVLLCSVGFIFYVLAGYPLLLAIYARLFARPIQKQDTKRRVTIVIPVRNGAPWIENKIRSMLASDYPRELIDILVVSNGSSDATEELVEGYPNPRVSLLRLPSSGKAAAISRAFEHVASEIIVLTDVRQEFDPSALTKLVACFADDAVGMATGELVIREGVSREEYNTGLYWRYEKWIRRNLNRIDAMLGVTGSICAIRRELAVPIPPEILVDDVYLALATASRGFRVYFEDQAKAYDFPTSLDSEFWRKVRTQAGIYQILFHFPALLWPGNSRFVHFLSHKLGRLVLPFAMIAVAISSIELPQPWRAITLTGQAIFYSLALIDPKIPETNPIKRFTASIRTFVVLVSAALCAVTVLVLPARGLWKETRVGSAPSSNDAGHTG